jgi:hypothetical protein
MTAPKRPLLIGFGVLLAGVSLLAVVQLFVMRFKSGDVYPSYSTLRADPLGTRVFYESVSASGMASVTRNMRDLRDVPLAPEMALFFLGDTYPLLPHTEMMPKDVANHLYRFVNDGGRMVVTLRPLFRDGWEDEADETNAVPEDAEVGDSTDADDAGDAEADEVVDAEDGDAAEDVEDAEDEDAVKDAEDEAGIKVAAWLGVEALTVRDVKPGASALLTPAYAEGGLPTDLAAYTSICFTNLHADWRVVYERDDAPVMLERRIGDGTIVLSALSYFVSNEALRDDCQPHLLAWLVGDRTSVIFDEAHLGIAEAPGAASLMRRYHLFGVVVACLLTALLFIWRNAIPLVPAVDETDLAAASVSAERDSAAGYVNLLRRSISRSEVLAVCVSKWRESISRRAADDANLQQDIDQMLAAHALERATRRKPYETYNAIARRVEAQRRGMGPEAVVTQQADENIQQPTRNIQ